jgi:NAD(P)H-dependent FMN reductase
VDQIQILLVSGSLRAASTNSALLRTAVAALRAQLEAADAVLLSTPEYAGALPGSFKNLLEWTVGGDEIYRLPVAWVNAAAPGRGERSATTGWSTIRRCASRSPPPSPPSPTTPGAAATILCDACPRRRH